MNKAVHFSFPHSLFMMMIFFEGDRAINGCLRTFLEKDQVIT